MDDRLIGYTTLAGAGQSEIEEKKSVFLGRAKPVRSEEEAQAFVREIKTAYADARHNVYAYLLSGGAVARMSDDGEPQGTAGVVLLDVLKKKGVTNAAIVVTRYFGGILLGAPGLVRAYSAAAVAAVNDAGIAVMVPYARFSVQCSYSEHPKLKRALENLGCVEEGTDFDLAVTLHASVEQQRMAQVRSFLSEFAAGRRTVTEEGTVLRPSEE